jgi:hypothetical protein
MSSLEGGEQREEGSEPSRPERCSPDSPKLERGVCPLPEAGIYFPGCSSEMG